MGEEQHFVQAVLRAASMSRQSSPIIPVPDVHGELSLFSSFSAAEISSGCCQGYLHPPACSTLCCFPVPPRAGARPRPGSACFCSGASELHSPLANISWEIKSGEKPGTCGSSLPAAWALLRALCPILMPRLSRGLQAGLSQMPVSNKAGLPP